MTGGVAPVGPRQHAEQPFFLGFDAAAQKIDLSHLARDAELKRERFPAIAQRQRVEIVVPPPLARFVKILPADLERDIFAE